MTFPIEILTVCPGIDMCARLLQKFDCVSSRKYCRLMSSPVFCRRCTVDEYIDERYHVDEFSFQQNHCYCSKLNCNNKNVRKYFKIIPFCI